MTTPTGGVLGNRRTVRPPEPEPVVRDYPDTGVLGRRRRRGPGSGVGTTAPDPLRDVDGTDYQTDLERRDDAYIQVMEMLNEYGLGSLADWVWEQLIEGRSDAEIERDIRKTPEFKKRFPAIDERVKRGLAPLSPAEYVAYERQARQLMKAAGLPESFYDTTDDFNGFLANDMSISELNDRIQLGRQAVYDAPADVRAALMRDYGMTEGDMTAYFLDEKRAVPILERQYRAAQIGGAASRTGFGATTREQSERLAGLGVTAEQAQEGFDVLEQSKELFMSLDRTEDEIGRDEQIDAAFGGSAAAQRRIEQRASKRRATFKGGGSFASGQGGLVGLGDTTGL